MGRLSCALVIPALDEEGAIGEVVRGFAEVRRPSGEPWLDEIVVADNASTDGTAEVARTAGASVVPAPHRGYGNACLAGLAHLAARPGGPPDVVVFADGDGANVASELPDLVGPIEEGLADLVIGSRVRRGEADALTVPQRFGNRLATLLFRGLYGVKASDLGPFRAIRWHTLAGLGMNDRNYGWTMEMQVKAAKGGVRTLEVDVSNKARAAGQSKVSGTVRGVVGAGYKILRTLVVYR